MVRRTEASMTGSTFLGLSLEQWSWVAALVAAVVLIVVTVMPPSRVFLARWRLFNPWILTRKERIEREADGLKKARIKAEENAMKSAILTFAVRWNPDPSLVIRNTGKSEARNVKVWGFLSQRHFDIGDDGEVRTHRLVGVYDKLLPGASTSEAVSNVEYQIEGGASAACRWAIRASWDDDLGGHRDEDFMARLADPNPA